jgi:oligopeptide transport system substrate-binding protein
MKSGDIPVDSFVPPMVTEYTHPALPHAGQHLADRQRRARALLTSAGFSPANPLEVTLRYAAGTDAKRANLATAAFWQQIGVRVELHQSELKVHYADLRQGNFDVAQAGWLGESNPEHYLGLLHSRAGDTNYGAFVDKAVDALIDQARTKKEVAERHRLLAQAEATAMKHYPVMPLFALTSRRLVRTDLRGWHDNPRDAHPARFLVR